MESLFSFIERQCLKYKIDESHGLKHAKGTMARAAALLATTPLPEDEERVALYAAALHDTCDSKYTRPELAALEIKSFLLSQGWPLEHIEALIKIVTSMSYSKLKRVPLNEDGTRAFPDHGVWQGAYHVARHADLLEGFIVARCILYNKELYPEKSDDEHWSRAASLFEERVFTYVSEGWITLPAALSQVTALESEARRCIQERSMDWPEPHMELKKN